MYRDSGPQLVEKYCEEIEFKTRSAKISIHIRWKSETVDFNIAGFHEGVTKAKEFIQKEFLPPEVSVLLLYHIPAHVHVQELIKAVYTQVNESKYTHSRLDSQSLTDLLFQVTDYYCKLCGIMF